MSETKRWLITGVSSGIGSALAEAVLKRGDFIIGCARGEAHVAKFDALAPGQTKGVQLDLSRIETIQPAVDKILADGPVDVLVNNAGQSIYGAFEEISVSEMKALFDVNVFGPWALAQAILPHMRERGSGQLIHMSSGCGLIGMGGLSAYCASKHALEGFSESMAQEIGAFGIKLLLVEPGAVATKFISHGTREAARRMPEYSFISGTGKSGLEGYYASAASSPEEVVTAIFAALDSPEPPLRVIVGDDLRGTLHGKGEQLLQLADG